MMPAIAAEVKAKSRCSERSVKRPTVSPPANAPVTVATSSSMPSRRLIRLRPVARADTALDVAITVMRLMPAAERNGRPTPRLRNGTRKTPPPMPSSDPSPPAAAPAAMTISTTAGDAMIAHCMRVDARESLCARLDAAIRGGTDANAITAGVKSELQAALREGPFPLDRRFLEPRGDTYARRLFHRDPDGRYTIVVMTWGPGQGTALHDHAGIWCVECVVEGRMEVAQFDLGRARRRRLSVRGAQSRDGRHRVGRLPHPAVRVSHARQRKTRRIIDHVARLRRRDGPLSRLRARRRRHVRPAAPRPPVSRLTRRGPSSA